MKWLAPWHTHDDKNNSSLSPLSTITHYLDYIQKVNQMLGIGRSFKKRKIGDGGAAGRGGEVVVGMEREVSNYIRVDLLHWSNYYIQIYNIRYKIVIH